LKAFKETLENHGICDIKNLELIDAEDLQVVTELVSDNRDSVLGFAF
jgi:hypothetical protein